MPTCPECGVDNRAESKFCAFCGNPMSIAAPGPAGTVPPAAPPPVRPAEECFGPMRPKTRDLTETLGIGMLLIVIGLVFLANPNLFTDFGGWIDRWTKQTWVPRPPETLIGSAILFGVAVGVTSLVTATARWFVQRRRHRILGDIMASIAWFAFAGLTYLYLGRALAGPVVVATEAVLVGVLLILYIVAIATRTFSPWGTPPPANP